MVYSICLFYPHRKNKNLHLMSKNITADLTDLQELLELFELMEQGAPWSSEILPLDGRMALLRRWLAEVRPREPAKVLALAVEGGSPPEKGGSKVRMSLNMGRMIYIIRKNNNLSKLIWGCSGFRGDIMGHTTNMMWFGRERGVYPPVN